MRNILYIGKYFVSLHKEIYIYNAKIMESVRQTNTLTEKKQKMTLRGYYNSLPRVIQPKQEFMRKVVERTGVTETTVRNWVLYGIEPQKVEYKRVICEITGLSEEELWG